MKQKTVLVSGASIAGPVLAFWLARFGFKTTIVERADSLRMGGQNIDIQGAARKIAVMMDIEKDIRAASTGELGVRFVDENDVSKAELPAAANAGEVSIGTQELEILRGDLAKILYDHTKDNVEYIFGDQISALEEQENGVQVSFQKGSVRQFDLVIAADGIRSRTRTLIVGDEPVLKPVGLYIAYFTVPRAASDTAWARWYNAPKSRVILLRPDNVGTTRASCSFLSPPMGYERLSLAEQKVILKEKYADVSWESPRIMAALDQVDDMYFDAISQVFAPRWSVGRLGLVGDAAFCPSPLSGMGASLSIVGAYVLAGELSRHEDHKDAFAAYEKLMRPFVKDVQKLPPGVPWVAHPKSQFGISLLNGLLRLISSNFAKRIAKLFSGKEPDDGIVLPVY